MTTTPSSTEAAEPVPTPQGVSGAAASGERRIALLRDYGIVGFVVAMFIALTFSTDTFLTLDNFKNLVDSSVAVAMIACAGTIVLIAGGFDLSAGAILLLSAVIGAKVSNDASPVVGVLIAVLAGCGLGLFNGVLCTVGRINHFVGTLGTSIAFAGIAVALSSSGTLLIDDESFGDLANSQLLGVNMSTWIMIVVALLCMFLLNRTVFGRHVFGTGGNIKAASLSGVPINWTLIWAYVLSGGVAAMAGLITAAQSLSVTPASGQNIIFIALSAILIGGNSVFGGEGSIWRTLIGVLILAMISNGFNLLGVDSLYQQIVNGAIILIAVGTDAWIRRTS